MSRGPIPRIEPMEISVVVPVQNEAANIPALCNEIRGALAGRPAWELLLVDDGSTDDTPTILRGIVSDQPEVRALRHRRCCGQSAAIRTGVRAASHPVIVTLDGDGQNDPRDIDRLLKRFAESGGEARGVLVAGFRQRRRDGIWRMISSRIANAVRSRLLRDGTPDTGCGLKVFPRALYLDLPAFDHMHRFIPALVRRAGGTVVSVEVGHRPRERGRSHYGTLDRLAAGLVDMAGVMWLMRRAKIPEIEGMEEE